MPYRDIEKRQAYHQAYDRVYKPRITGRRWAVQKATKSPTKVDLAWAAGFLEGEGYFGKALRAAQVQREPLERLLAIFGGSIAYYPPDGKPNHQGHFRWSACGARARGIMMTLFLFMSPRRQEQITLALR